MSLANGPGPDSLERVARLLREEDDYLVVSHHNPDGDAAGSLLAITHLLRAHGKRVTPYVGDPIPENLRFLPGADDVTHELPDTEHEWAILLDCGTPDRVSEAFDARRPYRRALVLDHHLTERPFGEVAHVDVGAAATGEILCRLQRELAWEPSPAFATCAYTAIFTDTGSFRFSNTNAVSLGAAARMAEAGADPHRIAEAILDTQPAVRLKLLSRVLDGMELHAEGRVALIHVPQTLLDEMDADKSMIEGFIDYPRAIDSVLIAAQIREAEPEQRYKVSLRSKGEVDVEAVARSFGGGGHKHAAGCAIDGDLREVRERLLPRLEEAVEPGDGA